MCGDVMEVIYIGWRCGGVFRGKYGWCSLFSGGGEDGDCRCGVEGNGGGCRDAKMAVVVLFSPWTKAVTVTMTCVPSCDGHGRDDVPETFVTGCCGSFAAFSV